MQARSVYNHAAVVLPVSQSLACAVTEVAPHALCRVISNVVDTSLFFCDQTDAHPSAIPAVLVVASLVPIKSVDTVVQATALLSTTRQDFRVIIIGEGPERPRLEGLVQQLGVESLVMFQGALPKTDIARWMRECAFLVVTSLWETQSVVTLEALCSGKRVLASAVGGLPELITGNRGVLFRQGRAEELAAKMALLLNTESVSGNAALATEAAAAFGVEAVARQLDAVYRSVAHRTRML